MARYETLARDPNILKDRLRGMASRDKAFGKITKDYTDKDWDDAISAGQKYNEDQCKRVYDEAVKLGDTERVKPTSEDELFEDYFDYGAKKHAGDKYNSEFKESMRLQNTPYNPKKDSYNYGKAPKWLDEDLEEDKKYGYFKKDYWETHPEEKKIAEESESTTISDYGRTDESDEEAKRRAEKGEKAKKRRIEELESKNKEAQKEIDELEGADL